MIKKKTSSEKKMQNHFQVSMILPKKTAVVGLEFGRTNLDKTFIFVNKRPVEIKEVEKLLKKVTQNILFKNMISLHTLGIIDIQHHIWKDICIIYYYYNNMIRTNISNKYQSQHKLKLFKIWIFKITRIIQGWGAA